MIFIAGATGFVGSHLIDALLKEGHQLRCLVRSEKTAKSFHEKGIEVVRGDITEPDTIQGALKDINFVIHLVGIIEEKGSVTFQRVHVDGTKNLVNEAKQTGVKHFFYQSALEADRGSWSGYLRTKAEAEEIVKASDIPYTVFRPSLIIGPWDGFTKRLMDIVKMSPVIIPVPGDGKTKFQPIYIKDWIICLLKVLSSPELFSGIFEIGGPEHLTYNEIVSSLAKAMKIKKSILHMPMRLLKLGAALAEKTIPVLPVTYDQLRLLENDNICDKDSVEKHFGFRPMGYKEALSEFVRT
ncbi:MAG: complex I NDUFA9 subunit family protein [Nitrospirae bacterium]|nr:complex I NDUFA9 subunit family protein [Nitrospirota bacterium]